MPTWKKTCHYGTLADINSWIYFFFQNQLLASTNNLKNRETWFVGYLLVAENWFCRQGCHRKAQPEPHGSWLNPFRRARNVGKFLQVSAPLCAPKKGWDQVACNGFFIVPILLSISQYLCVIFVNLRVQKNEKSLVEREAHSFCNEAFMSPGTARCHCDTRSFLLATPHWTSFSPKIICEENSSEIFGCW